MIANPKSSTGKRRNTTATQCVCYFVEVQPEAMIDMIRDSIVDVIFITLINHQILGTFCPEINTIAWVFISQSRTVHAVGSHIVFPGKIVFTFGNKTSKCFWFYFGRFTLYECITRRTVCFHVGLKNNRLHFFVSVFHQLISHFFLLAVLKHERFFIDR